MSQMERHWLRPKWYVTDTGGPWVSGNPYRHSAVWASDADFDCVVCGTSTLDAAARLDEQGRLHCEGCYESLHPHTEPVAPPRWQRPFLNRWWRIVTPLQERYDALYWWWCRRVGKRIYFE